MQAKWQCLARPMHQMDLDLIGARVAACLILHNMCVSDHVMEDVHARYQPDVTVVEDETTIDYPSDLIDRQGPTHHSDRSTIGGLNEDVATIVALTRQERWQMMRNTEEFNRLHLALQEECKRGRPKQK